MAPKETRKRRSEGEPSTRSGEKIAKKEEEPPKAVNGDDDDSDLEEPLDVPMLERVVDTYWDVRKEFEAIVRTDGAVGLCDQLMHLITTLEANPEFSESLQGGPGNRREVQDPRRWPLETAQPEAHRAGAEEAVRHIEDLVRAGRAEGAPVQVQPRETAPAYAILGAHRGQRAGMPNFSSCCPLNC